MNAQTPEQIALFQLCALKGALKLESLGMRRRGPSALSIVKKQFGFKGRTAADVLPQLVAHIKKVTQ